MGDRPLLLFTCHPLTGHVTPVLRIAAALHLRGWRVAFLSSAFFRARIEAAGLDFLPLLRAAAQLDDDRLFDREERGADAAQIPPLPGLDATVLPPLPEPIPDARFQTLFALPDAWASLRAALATLAARHPGARLLVVSEAFFYGAMPLKRCLARRDNADADTLPAAVLPRSVCISITAPVLRSVDLPPFGEPFPEDVVPPSHEDMDAMTAATRRSRLAALWEGPWRTRVAPLTVLLQEKLREACATTTDDNDDWQAMVFHDGAPYRCHDAIAQVGVPAFEYPRSDWPPGFRFVGIVPPSSSSSGSFSEWWDDLVENSRRPRDARKKVVVVAQGTVETDPALLIQPTLEALAGNEEVLVVAILGRHTRSQADADALVGEPPTNARVAGYLAYDAVLPLADVWVHNGGYGAVMHGIAHGVPQVVAGATQDKPENGRRVAWSGLGVDLATARPGPVALRVAITAVLRNSYAAKAAAMQATAQAMDLYANVEAILLEETAKCTG